jgi:hypothetical protein
MFIKSKINPGYVVVSLLLMVASPVSQAALTYYTNEADFNAAYSNPLSMESFESFSNGDTNIVTADFSMTTSAGGSNSINEPYIGAYPTDGSNYFGWAYIDNAALNLSFNNPINAFSMDITDLASVGGTTINFANNNGEQFDAAFSNFDTHGALDFFGVISDVSFTDITMTFETSEWIGIDRIQYGSPVPVPAAAWLFASGFVGLFGMTRRKWNIKSCLKGEGY